MRFIVTVLAVSCVIFISACTEEYVSQAATKTLAAAEDIEFINALDFSEELDSITYVTFDDIDSSGISELDRLLLRRMLDEYLPDNINLDALSQMEKDRIGISYFAEESLPGSMLAMMGALEGFYDNHGRLPESTGELLYDIIGADRMAEFRTGSVVDQLKWCLPYLNCFTGKLVATYTSDSWSPGGVYVRIISDENEIRSLVGGIHKLPVDPLDQSAGFHKPTVLWLVTVYGEEQSSQLLHFEWWRQ